MIPKHGLYLICIGLDGVASQGYFYEANVE